ncbi:MAG: lipopolysaccharide transport periplasmic protein LptA [Steroidobacteraceae bacterium]|jgi:lipopolysaccharide transport protein LptA
MAASCRNALILLLCLSAGAERALGSTDPARQLPILLDAQSSEVDYLKNELLFHKVKISQGGMSVSADQAQANGQSTDLNFEDSHWVFRGNVKIAMDQGQLESDEADVTFVKNLLAKAVVTGKPAAFVQHDPKNGKPVQGHAEVIEYDVDKATIMLSKDAWISNGPDEIRGETLKYNLLEKKMFANPSEQNSQRVHITITPPPPTPKP